MPTKIRGLVEDVVASPLGEVITAVGRAVAEAQEALDDAAVAKTLEIYTEHEDGEDILRVLREIGYRPTFYALPETTGEVNVALSLSGSEGQGGRGQSSSSGVNIALSRTGLAVPGLRPKMYATPIDASYANRYNYRANVSAKLTFKIVPVPAPNGADELRRVPDLVGAGEEEVERRLDALGLAFRLVDAAGEELSDPGDDFAVTEQQPAGGEFAQLGDTITVTMAVGTDDE